MYKARREGGKKVNDTEYLGRVVDKEKGVFRNKARGTFLFSFVCGAVETSPPKTDGVEYAPVNKASREGGKIVNDTEYLGCS